ncbi:MAG: hypothetical protein U0805_03275 [Pirellulales bacterium]
MRQFSIRELLMATAFVAVLLGWWTSRHNRPAVPDRYRLTINNGTAMMVDTSNGIDSWQQGAPFVPPTIHK